MFRESLRPVEFERSGSVPPSLVEKIFRGRSILRSNYGNFERTDVSISFVAEEDTPGHKCYYVIVRNTGGNEFELAVNDEKQELLGADGKRRPLDSKEMALIKAQAR